MIGPGSTIGIVGGGQLGRMLSVAAAQLGYKCHIFDPAGHPPAADVAARLTRASFDDVPALEAFAAEVDVATYEFENLPVLAPAMPGGELVASQVEEARAAALGIAEALDHVGVLTVEYFASADGPLVNEIAPRVHNSGHWTIEGAVTSQFEQHIRAICDLPPGVTGLMRGHAVMENLIGEEIERWP